MCGFKNPAKQERCRSCGAKVEVLAASYTSEEEQFAEVQNAKYKQKTEEYIEEGHSTEVEKNMVWGSTADKHAIREECSSAQIIYMESDAEAQLAVFHKIDKLKDKEDFGYWTDLKPVSMPPSKHDFFVHHDSKRLKKLIWTMVDRGIRLDDASSSDERDEARKEKPDVLQFTKADIAEKKMAA